MSNKFIYGLGFGILTILLAGHILGLQIVVLLSLVMACALILFCDTYTSTCFLFFFFPFSYIFTYMQYNLSIFLAVAYIIKSALKGRLYKYYFFTIILLVYCFVFSDNDVGIKLGTLISPIFLALAIFVCEETKSKDYHSFLNFFTDTFMISAIVGIFKENIPSIARLFEQNQLYIEGVEESLDIERFSGLSYDPNFFTVINCLLIAAILFNNKHLSIKNIVQVLFLVVIGFFTFSKSYVLLILFIGAAYIIKNSKHVVKNISLLAILILTFVLAERLLDIELFSLTTSRFTTAEDASDLTTGRLELWYEYFVYIVRNPLVMLFGAGFNALGLTKAVHNTFFEFVYRFGIIGSILWLVYFAMCGSVIKNKSGLVKKSGYIPLVVCGLGFMFLSAFHFQHLWCCVVLSLFSIYQPAEEKSNAQIERNSAGLQR